MLLRHLKFCYAEQSDAISIKHNYFDFMAAIYNNKQPSLSVNEPKNLQNILPFKANSQEKKVLHRKFIYESEQIRALKNKTNNEKEPIIFLTFFVWLLQYYGLEEFYLSVPFSLRKSEVDRENIGYYANLKILHFNPLYKIDNFAELLVLV